MLAVHSRSAWTGTLSVRLMRTEGMIPSARRRYVRLRLKPRVWAASSGRSHSRSTIYVTSYESIRTRACHVRTRWSKRTYDGRMTRKNTELDPLAEATVTDEGEAGPLIRADTWKSWGNAIELRDGYLVVDTRTSVEQVDVRPSREMLFEFASLQRASDDVAIRDFARIYGLLDLCSHHLSAGHPLAVGFN